MAWTPEEQQRVLAFLDSVTDGQPLDALRAAAARSTDEIGQGWLAGLQLDAAELLEDLTHPAGQRPGHVVSVGSASHGDGGSGLWLECSCGAMRQMEQDEEPGSNARLAVSELPGLLSQLDHHLCRGPVSQ
jgi:hypothetical protein